MGSDIFILWGMGAALGSDATDPFTLSLSYDSAPGNVSDGSFGIGGRDANGSWVNAVNLNTGGTKKFVAGPWQFGYGLGTYGVDPVSKTAWAVIHSNGEFAVARDIEDVPGLIR